MKHMRKFAFLLVVITLFVTIATPFSASAATPRLNNTLMTNENFIITDGVAYIGVAYTGYENVTTRAFISITLQRKTLFWWSEEATMSIGLNGWINSTSETIELSKTGSYRVIINYKISGSGGEDDELSVTLYDEY